MCKINVTGLVKKGMWAQITSFHTKSHFSVLISETEYLHSVTCIIKPMKCLLSAMNFIAIAYWYKSFKPRTLEKWAQTMYPRALFLRARSQTIIDCLVHNDAFS